MLGGRIMTPWKVENDCNPDCMMFPLSQGPLSKPLPFNCFRGVKWYTHPNIVSLSRYVGIEAAGAPNAIAILSASASHRLADSIRGRLRQYR